IVTRSLKILLDERARYKAARKAAVYYESKTRYPKPTLFPYTTLFRSVKCEPQPAAFPRQVFQEVVLQPFIGLCVGGGQRPRAKRSEEHTSELQSRENLVCRLLLEKKKKHKTIHTISPHNYLTH